MVDIENSNVIKMFEIRKFDCNQNWFKSSADILTQDVKQILLMIWPIAVVGFLVTLVGLFMVVIIQFWYIKF